MGNICQRNLLCHLSLVLLTAAALSPTSAGKPAREPEDYDETPPPLWHLAPGNLSEYSMQGNKIVIDAWNYAERMGLYKMMLNATATYFATLGPNDSGNILWGLPLQFAWQFITGRLADPLNTSTCGHDGNRLCISVHSWWACMNYYFTIIPFLGALESGVFGELLYEVEMLPPNERREDFCLSIAECNTLVPNIMSKWRHLFKYLLSTTPNSRSLSAAPSFSKDEALKYMWDAHDASNTYAFRSFKTDQCQTNSFLPGLPPRMLLEGDKAPFVKDFTPLQNKAFFLFSGLRKINEISGGASLLSWKTAMSTEAGRKIGRCLIESVVKPCG